MSARAQAPSAVPGIGDATAKAIRWAVEESVDEYFQDDEMPEMPV